EVFGKKLIDQPIMSRVLADMSLDVAGAVALALRLASSFDQAPSNEAEAAYARLMTPAIKYWVCKSAPILIGEAMECLGGNGYVEEGNLARQYREAPVNSIWEGSGNVMCLDVLRVLKKTPKILETVLDMLATDLGDAGAQLIAQLRYDATEIIRDEGLARIFVEKLALSAAAAELSRSVDHGLAEAFIATRLEGKWRATYGMLPSNFNAKEIVEFTCPEK
ncbi:Acyl-CoA dehydrogenase, partial [hydrothermal vent metagenome]